MICSRHFIFQQPFPPTTGLTPFLIEKRMRLTSVHVRSTSRILKPDAQKFSPCVGLLTSSTPNLIANLRSLQADLPASELARELFHQRLSSYDDSQGVENRRYGPVAVTKSRSRASYWLSSEVMGAMLGLAKSFADGKHPLVDCRIDEVLNQYGIETNYVNREWSGVSMVRYRKIVRLLTKEFENTSLLGNCPYSMPALPVALAFVWEKAKTKKCLLNYLLAVERASDSELLLPAYNDLRVSESFMQNKWLSDRFEKDFLTPDQVRAAGPQLLFASGSCVSKERTNDESNLRNCNNDKTLPANAAEALEAISASLAMERSFKLPIKLGRYAYGDGKARPDCVEVVVREIIDSLIYDPSSGRLCPELLPPTTLPAVVNFYKALETGEISDISTMPAPAKQKDKKKGKPDPTNTSGEANAVLGVDVGADVSAAKQYWETTTAGRVWFDLCSELQDVGYLSSTSDRRLYELKPSMVNVCAALRVLFGASSDPKTKGKNFDNQVKNQDESHEDSTAASSQALWKLDALERFWNAHVVALTATNEHCSLRPILTSESTLRFRAPFSDTETITRELGSIHFVGGRNALDIELESAHQLATVKHRLCVDPTMRVWGSQTRAPYASYIAAPGEESDVSGNAAVKGVVCSAVLGDALLVQLLKDIQQSSSASNTVNANDLWTASPQRDRRIVQALVAARWGEERRQGSDNKDTDGDSAPMSVTDASLTTADAKRQVDSAVSMSLQALQLVGYCQDIALMTHLVRWMLQESPSQLDFDAIATTLLLSYSPKVRATPAFQAIIRAHFNADQNQGALMTRLLNVGTDNCPSKVKFGLFSLSDSLSLSHKVKSLIYYMKYK